MNPIFSPRPDAPANLVANLTGNSLDLSWDAVTGADSYNVLLASSTGGPYAFFDNVATAFLNDIGLVRDSYYFVVQAVIDGVDGYYSNEVTVVVSGVFFTTNGAPVNAGIPGLTDANTTLSAVDLDVGEYIDIDAGAPVASIKFYYSATGIANCRVYSGATLGAETTTQDNFAGDVGSNHTTTISGSDTFFRLKISSGGGGVVTSIKEIQITFV